MAINLSRGVQMGLGDAIGKAFKSVFGFVFGRIAEAFLKLYTAIVTKILLPLIQTTPMPRDDTRFPPFHYPKNSQEVSGRLVRQVSTGEWCTQAHNGALATKQCKMWSELFYGLYLKDILPLAVVFFVIFYVLIMIIKASGLGNMSVGPRAGLGGKSITAINERFINAFLGILFWWQIGVTILFISNGFTDALSSMYTLDSMSSLAPEISPADGFATIPLLFIFVMSSSMMFVVTVFWVVRWILLIILTVTMPIIITLWLLDIGPLSSISKGASTLMSLYFLLAIAPIPAGIVLAMGGVISQISGVAVELITGSDLAKDIVKSMIYLAIPLAAGVIPFYMFKDQVVREIGSTMGPFGDKLSDALDSAMDKDTVEEKAGKTKAGALSAVTGQSYKYSNGEVEQSDEAGAGSKAGLRAREIAGSATDRMRGIKNKTKSAGGSVNRGAKKGALTSYAAWVDSDTKREGLKKIGKSGTGAVTSKVGGVAGSTKESIEEKYERVRDADEDTTSLTAAVASKGVQSAESGAKKGASAAGAAAEKTKEGVGAAKQFDKETARMIAAEKKLSVTEPFQNIKESVDTEERDEDKVEQLIEETWEKSEVDTAEEMDINPIMARAMGQEVMTGVDKTGVNEEKVENEFNSELDETVEIENLVGSINKGDERDAYKELLIGQYGKDEDTFNDDRKDWVAEETGKSRIELANMDEKSAMLEMMASQTDEEYEKWLTESDILEDREASNMSERNKFDMYARERYGGLEEFAAESRNMQDEHIEEANNEIELMETYVNREHNSSRTDYTNKLIPDSVDTGDVNWNEYTDREDIEDFDDLNETEQLKAISQIEDEELEPEEQIDPTKVSELIEEKGNLTDEDLDELSEEGYEDLIELSEDITEEDILDDLKGIKDEARRKKIEEEIPDNFDELSEEEKVEELTKITDKVSVGDINKDWIDEEWIKNVKREAGIDKWDEELLDEDSNKLSEFSEIMRKRIEDYESMPG